MLTLPLAGSASVRAAEPFCPEANIKIVAPFPPGGPTDITARLLGEKLRVAFGQTVVVEPRPGASGAIGTGYVAQQPGNGCTMLLSYDTHAVNPALYPLSFDTVTAFKPVMLIGTIPNAIAVHPSRPWKTFDELIAAAKKEHLVYATGATAGVAHFTMKLIEQMYGVEMQMVPYKGGAPAAQDLFGGHVPMMIGSVFVLAPGVRDGRVRALAQTGAKRHPLMPDVPTTGEAGYPSFELEAWVALFAPAGTPPEVIAKLTQATQESLKSPAVIERARTTGMAIRFMPPAELDTTVKADLAYWSKVIRDARIQAD